MPRPTEGRRDAQLLETCASTRRRSGRFKVYVIDEVHQLSGHAFNAMLKTLEEPPAHLKFILATTDPQKIPVTVLSRCLQFNLKQMPRDAIAQHLATVLEAESIAFEPRGAAAARASRCRQHARRAVAARPGDRVRRRARGSCRRARDARRGRAARCLLRLLEAIAQADGARRSRRSPTSCRRAALSFDDALQDLASLLLRIAIAQTVPDALNRMLPERDRILALAARIDPEFGAALLPDRAAGTRRYCTLAPDEHAGFHDDAAAHACVPARRRCGRACAGA